MLYSKNKRISWEYEPTAVLVAKPVCCVEIDKVKDDGNSDGRTYHDFPMTFSVEGESFFMDIEI